MKNWQFSMLCGVILLHLYRTSPEKSLPALVFAGICMLVSPVIATKKEKK